MKNVQIRLHKNWEFLQFSQFKEFIHFDYRWRFQTFSCPQEIPDHEIGTGGGGKEEEKHNTSNFSSSIVFILFPSLKSK